MTRTTLKCSVGSNPWGLDQETSRGQKKCVENRILETIHTNREEDRHCFRGSGQASLPLAGITSLLSSHVSDRRHRSQVVLTGLKELRDLLKRKAAIEEKIFAHTAILEKAYLDANQELSVSLKGRMQDITQLEGVPVRSLP